MSDYEVGYGKPPKQHQFKKGQSGRPDGGHAQRRAKKLARAEKEKQEQRKRDEAIKDIIRKVASEQHDIVIGGKRRKMSAAEIIVRKILARAMKLEASERQEGQAVKLLHHAKMLDPTSDGPRPMVLVVNQIKTAEQWAKDTEGELLPRNPLHGIPGAEGLNETARGRRGLVPDADD